MCPIAGHWQREIINKIKDVRRFRPQFVYPVRSGTLKFTTGGETCATRGTGFFPLSGINFPYADGPLSPQRRALARSDRRRVSDVGASRLRAWARTARALGKTTVADVRAGYAERDRKRGRTGKANVDHIDSPPRGPGRPESTQSDV
jgi:hypothetical protein